MKMASIEEIRVQWQVVRDCFDDLYGPLALLEDECQKMNSMLGVEDGDEEPTEETDANPPRSGRSASG